MGADNLCEFEVDGVRCPAIFQHYTVSQHRTCGENHGPQTNPDLIDIVTRPGKACHPDWDKHLRTPVDEKDVEISIWGCRCGRECEWQMTTRIREGRFNLEHFPPESVILLVQS